ncbi:MAG: dicarboxylate/amino acid:cation symporter [Vicinamibacterales bacterium]|nr:dicarboxylate/amino acid:cation symporter [Vicinamibacterales bacterium]
MPPRTPLYARLYLQVLAGIALGALLGTLRPELGADMKPVGDAFIKLIRMIIAPVIFTTVVTGIATMGDIRDLGRIGIKTLLYFEVITTPIVLAISLTVVNLLQPGAGINADASTLDPTAVAAYATSAEALTTTQFLLNIIPTTLVDAFAKGDILQVLFVSVLFGLALLFLGERGKPLLAFLEGLSETLFGVVKIVMRAAPVGAFGAMAFTIGTYGVGTLLSLGKLMAAFYLACLLFILIGMGAIAKVCGFSIVRFLVYIREEILIVLGTSSSESVLPRLMARLEQLGCSKRVVGLVVPTGYSMNLDGTTVYMAMAAVFIAQATNTPMPLGKQLGLMAVLMLTSKGAAGVTGSGFVTLAATLSAIPSIPVAGLALLVGVDRFMSEARAITNLIGNALATVVVAKWDGALDVERMERELASPGADTRP